MQTPGAEPSTDRTDDLLAELRACLEPAPAPPDEGRTAVAEGETEVDTDICRIIGDLPPGELPRILDRLEPDERDRVLGALPADDAADLLEALPEAQAAAAAAHLEPGDAARILESMHADERADLLGDLDDDAAEAILDRMAPDAAADARSLVAFDPETGGGVMTTEYLAFRAKTTVAEIVDDLRTNAERYRDYDVQYVYVVDVAGKLVGVLRLRDLLLARRSDPANALMIRNPFSVSAAAGLEELHEFFERYDLFGVPVVDEDDRLVGVVQPGAVEEARMRRGDDDYRKSQGIVGGEELRSMPLALRSRRRLSWLSINIVLNIVAASVIALQTDVLDKVIALAVFLPIISDMSGCSGNQAVAVSMRELTMGVVRPTDVLRTWLKEISVGLINGAILGVLLGVAAWLWQGEAWLGLVVGGALAVNTMVAVSIGGTIPLVLRRYKLDPALASGPVLTTVTDLCGFMLALGFARIAIDGFGVLA